MRIHRDIHIGISGVLWCRLRYRAPMDFLSLCLLIFQVKGYRIQKMLHRASWKQRQIVSKLGTLNFKSNPALADQHDRPRAVFGQPNTT